MSLQLAPGQQIMIPLRCDYYCDDAIYHPFLSIITVPGVSFIPHMEAEDPRGTYPYPISKKMIEKSIAKDARVS